MTTWTDQSKIKASWSEPPIPTIVMILYADGILYNDAHTTYEGIHDITLNKWVTPKRPRPNWNNDQDPNSSWTNNKKTNTSWL